ncbi:hypothetical protein [Streptomyces ossamyceticus]|uniref:S-adenosyl methyltransferase n=1 Tax=Streptomyces ossamyceticus TaxID=249581 RepID=A0ABV2V8Z0_9ACTN
MSSRHSDARSAPAGTYDLASKNFVAESVTEDPDEFADFCRAFAMSVRPGGPLVASFMENMPTYRIGVASRWPGCPVDRAIVRRVFAPYTERLRDIRIDADPTVPDYGDTGMVLMRAVRTRQSLPTGRGTAP